MPFTIKEYKKFNKNEYDSFILGGDIGGTNTNLGIFGIKNKFPVLLLSFHFKSQELRGLHYAVNETLDYIQKDYNLEIFRACFAVAGVLSPNKDFAKITHVKWNDSNNVLFEKTKLKKIVFMNDFEAIGYGINMLNKKDIVAIKKTKKIKKAPILVIGAGTGLGKTILIYNEQFRSYAPIPSEAGHSDFAPQNSEELDLINFIKRYKKIKHSISYEQVLSGQGLVNIYLFLRHTNRFKETKYTKDIDKSKNKPELISKYRNKDKTCKATFKMLKAFYARFAKNFALDSLAFGGVYIAGGIAAKNRGIFDNLFIRTFEDNYKLRHVLKAIPIYLILNYNVGLLGAGFAGAKLL